LSKNDVPNNETQLAKKFFQNSFQLFDSFKIFEFFIGEFPNEFFDTQSLNFSRIVNFLKNASSRVLKKPNLNSIIQFYSKLKLSKTQTFNNITSFWRR